MSKEDKINNNLNEDLLEKLLLRVKATPELPGVYLMKDSLGEVIYVGKAISLKSRLRSYFNNTDTRAQIEHLLKRLFDIETIITEDERQALILEIDLIQKFKPRYNIRLKDDKAPLMVKVNFDSEWPRLELVRKKDDDLAKYFGPYPFRYELTALLDAIDRALPIRTCTDKIMKNRVRPCLQYQIKRCAAPCCLKVDKSEYVAWLEEAVSILDGNTDSVIEDLYKRISHASEQLRFEDAAILRDRLRILEKVKDTRSSVFYGDGDIDAFSIYREGNSVEVSILRAWNGKLSEGETFGFSDVSMPNEEILSSVLSQFYSTTKRVPDEILIPDEIEDISVFELYISEKFKKSIKIHVPQRGLKHRLMALSKINAKENFEARFSSDIKSERVLEALKDTLQLEQVPRLIECIDISHIQGTSTVGAVVCFKDAKPDKSRYRYFHLSQEGKPDDFASMNETVRRHLSRCMEEDTLCDLLVIDGGPPQIIQALKVRSELGLNYPAIIALAKKRTIKNNTNSILKTSSLNLPSPKIIPSSKSYAIKKKPERIYVEDSKEPLVLSSNSEVLKLLEQIRDETHRSAITFHRKTRARKQFKTPLDKVPGLGPKRKMTLLKEFGSIARIRSSSAEDIKNRAKIPERLAHLILKYLNSDE